METSVNQYLSLAQVGKKLGISRIAVYKRVKNGTIEAERCGRGFTVKSDFVIKPRKKIWIKTRLELLIEELLNELAPNKFLFVGNKKIKIEKFIPDFIRIDEKKQIIESFGAYWHAMKNANDKKRIESYKKYGFKVLIVLEKESKNIEALKAKIQNFISS